MTRYPNADVWSESLVVVEIYLRLCSVFVDAFEKGLNCCLAGFPEKFSSILGWLPELQKA